MPARDVPATAVLCGLIVVTSLVCAILGRTWGVGVRTLSFQRDAIFDLELWRLVTYPFVESSFWGLMFSVVVLWIFGGWFETRYGRADYLRFCFWSTIGAAIFAVPLCTLFNVIMPFFDPGIGMGPNAVLDAMLVAFALANPDSTILFGFVLPMRTRTVIFAILGLAIVSGILEGAANLSMTCGGMATGYVLVTGYWRPRRLINRIRAARFGTRRNGLYVVPPNDKTLH
jgi:membrane associated rhomboid family serine protease